MDASATHQGEAAAAQGEISADAVDQAAEVQAVYQEISRQVLEEDRAKMSMISELRGLRLREEALRAQMQHLPPKRTAQHAIVEESIQEVGAVLVCVCVCLCLHEKGGGGGGARETMPERLPGELRVRRARPRQGCRAAEGAERRKHVPISASKGNGEKGALSGALVAVRAVARKSGGNSREPPKRSARGCGTIAGDKKWRSVWMPR